MSDIETKENSQHGFTLIELLVGIVLMVILAFLVAPLFVCVEHHGPPPLELMNAKQIGMACRLYALDHEGRFPSYALDENGKMTGPPPSSANEALAQLVPNYVPDEKVFWLAKDRVYCNTSAPDNKAPWLGAGENHWGYVINLTETSDPRFPLIADGAAFGATHYSLDPETAGGTWKGKWAIVIFVDGSGGFTPINKTTLTIPGPIPTAPDLLAAGQKDWLSGSNRFLNPIPKAY